MRILIVTPKVPYPPDRGDRIRMFNIITRLAENHTLTVLAFSNSRQEGDRWREVCPGITLKTVRLPRYKVIGNSIVAIPTRYPLQVRYFASRAMKDLVDREIAAFRPDLVYAHLIRTLQFTDSLPVPNLVLDMVDCTSLLWEHIGALSPGFVHRILALHEVPRLKNLELRSTRFDLVTVCSPRDLRALKTVAPEANVDVVPNGVDLTYFSPSPRPATAPNIVFTGNLGYYPNEDAIRYFLERIFPGLKNLVPDATLTIAGGSPPRWLRNTKRDGVTVTGYVDDIRPFLRRAAVSVCPVRIGAGTPGKAIESMAMGVPVVATPFSVQGLGVRDNSEVLLGRNSEEFARAIAQVIRNPSLARGLARRGRAYVETFHDWDKIVADLELKLNELTKKPIWV